MVRRKFVVKGVVQGVGYRALVRQVARNLGIKGMAKTLEDGSVEIFADGTSSALETFREKVDRHGNPDDFTRIHVAELKEILESEFEWPNKEFKWFEIDPSFKIDREYERAILDDLEIMKMSGGILRQNMDELTEGSKMFAQTTGEAFGSVFEKYGSFSEDMHEIKDTLRELKDLFGDFTNRYFQKNR